MANKRRTNKPAPTAPKAARKPPSHWREAELADRKLARVRAAADARIALVLAALSPQARHLFDLQDTYPAPEIIVGPVVVDGGAEVEPLP